MPDRVLERRRHIQRDLDLARAGYAELWQRVTGEWRDSLAGSHMWLTYAANYLFSCDGFKWALDPFAMSTRVPNLVTPDYRADLEGLSLVVLTHEHNDHLDTGLIKTLADKKITWVIPAYVQRKLEREDALPAGRVITPLAGESVDAGPLRLLPFNSLHMRGGRGVPETGYLVQYNQYRWLFPCDIRDYDHNRLTPFGKLTAVVAHLWLGKARALDSYPPLVDEFCDFYTSFDTDRLIIAHMNEFGRDEHELWQGSHFDLVKSELLRRNPAIRVEKALMGDRIELD